MKKVVDCVKACEGVSRLQRASGLRINVPESLDPTQTQQA
jgi:hypothetical protein